MARYDIAPTKSNLLNLKRDLEFGIEGFELLDQKRNILVVELMSMIDEATRLQNDVDNILKEAYLSLENAVINSGRQKVEMSAAAVNTEPELNIRSRKVMGVLLPLVDTKIKEYSPYFDIFNTDFWIDDAIKKFRAVLDIIGRFVELKIGVMRLAKEVNKTIRKVNALEKIAIPDYNETIKYIEERIEESDRDSLFVLKLLKKRLYQRSELQ